MVMWRETEESLSRETQVIRYLKSYDERIGSYYLELFGRIDSGDFVYMSTNYQSMKKKAWQFLTVFWHISV